LQEDAGRRQTQAQQDHRKVQAFEDSAKELEDGLEALSSRSKAKDAAIASLEERLRALTNDKRQLAKAKDQALLDAKRALSSISSSGKGAKEALRQKEMAEEDRDIAFKQMEEARETAARAAAAAAEAIRDRDRVLALKASVDAQAVDNGRIRADLHAAHEAQTKAEAERFTAQQSAVAAEAERAAAHASQIEAEAARDAAVESQNAAEQALEAANQELEAKKAALADALTKAERAETLEASREKEVAIWRLEATEMEKKLMAEQDKIVATQVQFTSMKEKLNVVLAGNTATQEQIEFLEKQLEISDTEAANLRNQLKDEFKRTEQAQNKLDEAVKKQQRLENEVTAAQEAAVQSAEEEILSVRRELEARVAESDGEIKHLRAQLDAATLAAKISADESAERVHELEEELENLRMAAEKAIEERNKLQNAVNIAEIELELAQKELVVTNKSEIKAVAVVEEELRKEISQREEAEKNLDSLKIELQASINARDSAQAEVKSLQEALNVAWKEQTRASAATDADNAQLFEELAVVKKKNKENEKQILALLDAKTSLEIAVEDEKKKSENLRELNRRLLSRGKTGVKETPAKATATTTSSCGGGSSNSNNVEEGSQSPALMKAKIDLGEKMDTLKKSTEKLNFVHRSSSSPGGGGVKTVAGATPTRSPLSRPPLEAQTP
jgi:hypothetical protein